ncbi:MAG: hypothetical protein NC311_18695 [Muribaculaceae bacterium]|nr:hypothetical protein [Muribaculaceae bacterium]
MRRVILAVSAVVVMSMLFAPSKAQINREDTTPIVPTIAKADRHQKGKIFLEQADTLKAVEGVEYQILTGNVMFRKEDMFMYCDSAYFFERTNSLQAFGNVRMEQGDTLFVYADELDYNDSTELAVLYANAGKKVRLINRDVELQTNPFYYDLGIDLGYYENNGTLTDKQNRLVSGYGEYAPNTAEALFRNNVVLTSLREGDTLDIFTDQLYYNTNTHIAEMDVPSIIVNKDGKIFTDSAIYNTETSFAELYRRSVVVTGNNNRLTGDSLIYDRNAGYGEAFGDIIITDSLHNMMLTGDYGFYNELTDSAFVTGRALAKEYSQGDTLYLHSDTIRTFAVIKPEEIVDSATTLPADTAHYVVAAHKVRFYRSDMQGVCDSMTFVQTDSMLYLNRHPIVWSDNRQIFGNVIQVHMNDSTIDYALLPDFGYMIEEIEEGYYQQLAGKEMLATFIAGELSQLDVKGNVLAITFPEESDSTINKVASLESSYMTANFEKRALKRMKTWPDSKSVITPLYLAKRASLYLENFNWYPKIRPSSPEDVFVMSQEFLDLLASPDPNEKRTGGRRAAVRKTEPAPKPLQPIPNDSTNINITDNTEKP